VYINILEHATSHFSVQMGYTLGLYGTKGGLTYVLSPLTYHVYEYYQVISSNQFNYLVKGVCASFQM
jgi:hypothetical protein